MVGQDGFKLIEDEGGGFHRGHLLDSSAEGLHECPEHPERQDDVVSAFGMGVLDKIAKGESAAQAQKDNM